MALAPVDREDEPVPTAPTDAAPAGAVELEDFGAANEHLPPNHQRALHELVTELLDQDAQDRRDYFKRIKKLHRFFRGEQYVYWHPKYEDWIPPTIEQYQAANQPFRFVTNIVRPFTLTLMAALSQSIPKIKFWPQSPQQEDDVATAEAAFAIAEHIQRANRMERLVIDESFHLCLDGMVGGYVRWVVDADRFGTTTKPVIENVPTEQPGGYQCPGCELIMPAPGVCTACQYPVGPEHAAPPIVTEVPTETGQEEIPNGQVVIDMIGALNMRIPLTARDQRDYAYLDYVSEIAGAKVKAVHPHVADKIGKGDGLGTMYEKNERQDRLSLASGRRGGVTSGTDTTESLVTYHRIWLRPWTFAMIKDLAIRKDFEQRFAKGCRVIFADDLYCEARESSMDDHWRVNHAIAGDGQARDGLLYDLISIQERFNTLKNLQMETWQHGIPTLFMDRDVVNVKAWEAAGSRPGAGIGVRGRAGVALSNAFHETEPAKVSRDAIEEGRILATEDAQFSTGGFAALFGGGALNTETASGYAMQRDQAMGRLGMVFRAQREFHAELITLGVEEQKRHMDPGSPMEVALLGPAGQFDTKSVRLDDLRGRYRAYPEADEGFPESFSQKKQSLMEMIAAKSPVIDGSLGSPNVQRALWRTMGITDFETPGEAARKRQYREIQALLQAAPPPPGLPTPGPIDPMTGVQGPPMPPPPMSSIPVDVEFDDHAVHFATIREWMETPAAETERAKNPAGWENVRQHGLEHKAVLDQQMAQQLAQQAAAAAPQAPPPQ